VPSKQRQAIVHTVSYIVYISLHLVPSVRHFKIYIWSRSVVSVGDCGSFVTLVARSGIERLSSHLVREWGIRGSFVTQRIIQTTPHDSTGTLVF